MSNTSSIAKNVSMFEEQWEVVEAINQRYGFRNTSTALRFIVTEYQRMAEVQNDAQPAPSKVNGK